MQNNTYKNQSVNISRVMVLPARLKKIGEFSLDLSRRGGGDGGQRSSQDLSQDPSRDPRQDPSQDLSKDLTRALFAHQDEIFSELSRAGIFVSAKQKTSKLTQKSKDIIIIFPVIIGVSVKGNFVIISVYEKNFG